MKRILVAVDVQGTEHFVIVVPDDATVTTEMVWRLLHEGAAKMIHSETEWTGDPEWTVDLTEEAE